MSYQHPQQPPQGYGAYGQPPQGQYAQQPQYPQQPPYPQQPYGAPPGPPPQGQYPPQQGHYGAPPPGPPPQGYGAPPQHAPGYGAPPQAPPYGVPPHGAPPQHAPPYHTPSPQPPAGYHSTPSPQPGYNQPPPFQQNYGPPPGAPPMGAGLAPHGAGFAPGPGFAPAAPAMPSLGYAPGQTAPGDFRREAETLRKAMKGFGTDEKALIQVLARLDPLQMAAVRATYSQHIGRDLHKDVKSETGGYLERGLLAVIDGPLGSDVAWAFESVEGLGTKEWLMNEALLGRSNADMRAIRTAYEHKYHRQLHRDIADDLSFKTALLFKEILTRPRAEESTPLNSDQILRDVETLYHKKNPDKICEIFGTASNAHLRAMDQELHAKYRTSLPKTVERNFDGHMQDALWFIAMTATDPAMRDAQLLEKAMSGMGTKDEQLVTRIVRLHWNRDHKDQVKRAYRHEYKRDLIERVRSETSGDYEALMVALLQ